MLRQDEKGNELSENQIADLEEKGERGFPVVGELSYGMNHTTMDERTAKILNKDWFLTGKIWLKDEKKKAEPKPEVDEKAIRAEAFSKAEQMVEAGDLEKMPAKNIKTEDLINLVK